MFPWLILGTLLGTIGGCIASQPEGYNHGTEEEALLMYRTFYGAGAGLVLGLIADIYVGFRRCRLPPPPELFPELPDSIDPLPHDSK
jgi:hypothetical protein